MPEDLTPADLEQIAAELAAWFDATEADRPEYE